MLYTCTATNTVKSQKRRNRASSIWFWGKKKIIILHSSTNFHRCEKDFTLPNPTGNKEEGNSHNSRDTGPPKKYLRRHKIIRTSTWITSRRLERKEAVARSLSWLRTSLVRCFLSREWQLGSICSLSYPSTTYSTSAAGTQPKPGILYTVHCVQHWRLALGGRTNEMFI